MNTINFNAEIVKIGTVTLLLLPKSASIKLPSRGLTFVKGTINNFDFQSALEPDGKGSHWLNIDQALLKGAQIAVGDTAALSIEPSKEWPEPKIPNDFKTALNNNPKAEKIWASITPMARWDWIRWINATKNLETRKIRIEKTFSKFNSGIRRPCCFNRTECTVPEVSEKGVLLE